MSDQILKQLEIMVNQVLADDQDTIHALEVLTGRVIALEFIKTRFRFYILPSASGIQLLSSYKDKVHVTIRATPSDMLNYLITSQSGTVSTAGSLEVIGDVGLAQQFQGIMKNVDLDWEEYLSRYTGDVFSHKFGNFLRGGLKFGQQARVTLEQDIGEYLQFEKELLPDQTELEKFYASVDELRDDVERLKMRIERLHRTTVGF